MSSAVVWGLLVFSLTVSSSLELRIPRLNLHVKMFKTYLQFVQYSINATYIREFNASNYVSQINYLDFLVLFMWNNLINTRDKNPFLAVKYSVSRRK